MDLDKYFISLAEAVSKRSDDSSTKVGCVIVTEDYEPISFGSNGFLAGCSGDPLTLERPYKDMLSTHAEMNALIFAKRSIENSRVYVTNAPCDNCLKYLLRAKVKEIVFDKFDTNGGFMTEDRKKVIKKLLASTSIIYRNIDGKEFF